MFVAKIYYAIRLRKLLRDAKYFNLNVLLSGRAEGRQEAVPEARRGPVRLRLPRGHPRLGQEDPAVENEHIHGKNSSFVQKALNPAHYLLAHVLARAELLVPEDGEGRVPRL